MFTHTCEQDRAAPSAQRGLGLLLPLCLLPKIRLHMVQGGGRWSRSGVGGVDGGLPRGGAGDRTHARWPTLGGFGGAVFDALLWICTHETRSPWQRPPGGRRSHCCANTATKTACQDHRPRTIAACRGCCRSGACCLWKSAEMETDPRQWRRRLLRNCGWSSGIYKTKRTCVAKPAHPQAARLSSPHLAAK